MQGRRTHAPVHGRVTHAPVPGRKKTAWKGDKQTRKHSRGQTLRLLDRIGPVGRFDENQIFQENLYLVTK